MNNPYTVLNLAQGASNKEILQAVAHAMRLRKYSTREIAEAQRILMKPASRLAADFTFPIFPKKNNIATIQPTVTASGLTVDQLDPDKYDSL